MQATQRPPTPHRKATPLGIAIGRTIWTHRTQVVKQTQQWLADELGVAQATVSLWETGRYIPEWSTLKRLSQSLGIPFQDFINHFEQAA